MPANQSPSRQPLGALPSRFRRPRLLLVGCGDVGLRVARFAARGPRLLALTSSPQRVAELRAQGVVPLLGNLDAPASLRRLAGLADRVLHLAPPPGEGEGDPRTLALARALRLRAPPLALARALRLRAPPLALVYVSTSGVYGDCQGHWVDETRVFAPQTARARRRVHAEDTVRFLGRSAGVRVSLLRAPGIYASDRVGGTPIERLRKGTPALRAEDDVYTNHIHADDLARACLAALWRGAPQRAYNASDDTVMTMGDYFDLAADLYGLPRAPRISRAQARETLPASLLSFMSESRRLRNGRLKNELRLRLRHPTVQQGLRA